MGFTSLSALLILQEEMVYTLEVHIDLNVRFGMRITRPSLLVQQFLMFIFTTTPGQGFPRGNLDI